MNKTSSIYISGHTGLLGSALMRVLTAQGYTNLITRRHKANSNSQRILFDLTNQKDVDRFFETEQPDYVFHCAAYIGGITATEKQHADFLYRNTMINFNVIDCARRYMVRKMIIPCSVCTFPRDCPLPIKEEYALTGAFEKTCEGYAIAKMASQKMCQYFNESYGTNFLTTNLCNLYGLDDSFKIQSNHVIPVLIYRFHEAKNSNTPAILLRGTGNATRQFMYADDVAEILVQLMNKDFSIKKIGSALNVTTTTTHSIRELAQVIARVVGYEGSIEFNGNVEQDGAPARSLDSSLLQQIIPLKEGISLEEGIKRVYEKYLSEH